MRKIKELSRLLCFMAFSIFGSYGQFVLETAPPYCHGENVTIHLDYEYIGDFFTGCLAIPGNVEVYIEYTASNNSTPLTYGINYLPTSLADGLTGTFTIEPTEWFSETDIILTAKGYYSIDGGITILECPYAIDQFLIHARETFPTISGPTTITDFVPTTYSVPVLPPEAGAITYDWTVPAGWSTPILNSPGNEMVTTPSTQDGPIQFSTTPEIIACNYPAILNVELNECAGIGQTHHTYCDPVSWSTDFNTGYENDENKYPRKIGDFNGDGQDDVIHFAHDHVSVGVSTGSSFLASTWSYGFTYGGSGSTQEKYPRKIGDFNGDGKDDIISFGHTQTVVGISTGASFITSSFDAYNALSYSDGYDNRNEKQRLIGDFDGNGMDDIVAFGYSAHDVALSNGSSFNANIWSGSQAFSMAEGWTDFNKYPKMVGDFNGDGMDDIIGFGEDLTIVGLSTGTSFNTSTWTPSSAFSYGVSGNIQSKYPRMIGDFNGDGMDDIISFGHNTVVVGISTGSSFVFSTWLTDHGFTNSSGWHLDAREIGVVSFDDLGEYFTNTPNIEDHIHFVRIGDANADGLDDIIGFGESGLHISYSDGDSFLCPAINEAFANDDVAYGNETGYQNASMLRLIGNFDITDDELEYVGFNYDYTEVMDCDMCEGNSHAEAVFESYYNVHQETGYQGWTVDVHEFCNNNVVLDVRETDCENAYWVQIHEFNLATWTSTNVYSSNWIGLKAPDFVDIGTLYTFEPNKLYMVSFIVGPEWSTVNLWMELAAPESELLLEPDYSELTNTKGGSMYVLNKYCDSRTSIDMHGVTSQCYDKYRFEMIEVSPSTLIPIGSPIQQLPAGGGWTNGVSMPVHIPMPTANMVSGKVYRLQLFVQNVTGTDVSTKYVKLIPCKQGLRQGESNEFDATIAYPNPTEDNFINLQLADYGENGAIATIYSTEGQSLVSRNVNSNSINIIEFGNLAPGTYSIKIESDLRVETILFVKN